MKRSAPLCRSTPPKRTRLKRTAPIPIPPIILAYWDWIREQRCHICRMRLPVAIEWSAGVTLDLREFRQQFKTELAHVGLRGLGQKCDPREVMPLCCLHHTSGAYAHHRLGKRFWEFHGLEMRRVVREYLDRYESETGISLASVAADLRVELVAFDQEAICSAGIV